jgi:aerobic-type carbon monoxide dehydrogenase small subunit (CoxS/CutS family)
MLQTTYICSRYCSRGYIDMTFYFLQDVPSPMEEEVQKNLEEEKSEEKKKEV